MGSVGSGCGSCNNVEEERVREESCSVGWFCIVVVGISSRSEGFSVGSASGDVVLLFGVLLSCVGVGVGAIGCVVVVVVVIEDCCCSICSSSFIRRRDCMLRMICRLIASRSADNVVSVVALVVKGRWQPDVVSVSGGGVETRDGVIIVVGADRCASRRNRLIARCGKGNFSTSAATVR